ncbi:LPS export ABC transporter periplasmic protein LptC [Natronospirillum operosum]|uniref:LPS export ABC transporter periplasmic protein LptC n=1 Tax=Natronospirillum operosum TaxID=2759953 RepID=A0A4Z0W6S9_9GAMM|nr:LPS export ABC transporter periplasmic protein LptC [Natronospirillum operosum]TGG90760.1 LPS export ABC transporter periplasmic protein LptC [Natronospirillum operosum]
MSRWLALLFAALAVGIGILLLNWQTPDAPPETDEPTATPPQLIMDGLRQITTAADGTWRSTLHASQARYFEADDRLELVLPQLWQQRDDDQQELRADFAELLAGNLWTLSDNVLIINNPGAADAALIHTEYLEYDTLSDIAQTQWPVRIEQTDRLFTTAVGMTLNFTAQEFELHEDVRTRIIPESAQDDR